MATMGGGVWAKTEQVYYYLDPQGRITKVNYYPYGKWKFLLHQEGAPGSTAQASAQPPSGPEVTPVASPTPITPQEPAPLPAATSPPIALPEKQAQPPRVALASPPKEYRVVAPASMAAKAGPDVEATTHLELNMTKEEVRRGLGGAGTHRRHAGRGKITGHLVLHYQRLPKPKVFSACDFREWAPFWLGRIILSAPPQGSAGSVAAVGPAMPKTRVTVAFDQLMAGGWGRPATKLGGHLWPPSEDSRKKRTTHS